jgi:hypothetical protein
MRRVRYFCLPLALALILSACNLGASAPQDPSTLSTAAAQTVEAVLATATSASLPLATQPAPPSGSAPTNPPDCKDSASIISWTRDNIPYEYDEVDRRLAPNSTFTMAWVLQNSGSCVWNNTYQMYFDSGTSLTNAVSFPVIPIGSVVESGGTLTVQIPMTAPAANGDYESTFRFQNERGEAVSYLGVITKVGNPTSSSGSLAKPGDLRYTYDCTSGVVSISLFWVDKSNDEKGFRIYRDGSQIGETGANSTTYNDIAPSPGSYTYTVAAFNASGEAPQNVKVDTSNCK